MIRVTTGSRVHFGMLMPAPLEKPARRYGGVGLMVDSPGLSLTIQPDENWNSEGPLADRALAFAHRFVDSLEEPIAPHRLIVESAPKDHVGLGTGTQLGLAVAHGLARLCHLDLSIWDLARRVGRGRRSALGVYGFERGGFLVEAGQGSADCPPPLIASHPFPEEWGILLLTPEGERGRHGQPEEEVFNDLNEARQIDELARLVLLGILPALHEMDLDTFGESVYELNRKVGERFASSQGGIYANSTTGAIIDQLRRLGIRGVGQSSWGPTVFAILERDRMRKIADRLSTGSSLAIELGLAQQGGVG